MSFEDEFQIDPATLPENVELMASLNEVEAEIGAEERRHDAMASLVAGVVPIAADQIEHRARAREATSAREDDLRMGLANALRELGHLVLTEPKLAVPGWGTRLGGFDLAVVVDNSLVVAETKWGKLDESMWDIFKLACARHIDRVDAAVAVYGAPVKQWDKPESCADLFKDRHIITSKLIEALPKEWGNLLAGSPTVEVHMLPSMIHIGSLASAVADVFGREWEVRAISVKPDGGEFPLKNGWPHGAPLAAPGRYIW